MEYNQELTFNENGIESLIAACLLGNESAKKMMLNNYLSFADTVVHRYISNKQWAEELTNDGLMKMLDSLETYDPEKGSFDDWFKHILKYTALDALKVNKKYFRNIPIDEMEIEFDEPGVISKIGEAEILKLVEQLPEACKAVFNLYVTDEHSHSEIAQLLGITEATSRKNLTRARNKLKIILQNLKYPIHDK